MAITYTWKVTSLKVKNEGTNTNAVVQTYWEKIGTDGNGNEGKFIGATPFTTVGSDSSFIPFDQLTEETVLGWIKAQVVGQYEQHVNEKIAEQIDAKVNVVQEMKMPWAPDTEDALPGTVPGATGATGP